jgi:hypothetical protein
MLSCPGKGKRLFAPFGCLLWIAKIPQRPRSDRGVVSSRFFGIENGMSAVELWVVEHEAAFSMFPRKREFSLPETCFS